MRKSLPENKMFSLYFLVFQYLERNCVTEFGRDNFSFNTKVNVGEFFENRAGGENVSLSPF